LCAKIDCRAILRASEKNETNAVMENRVAVDPVPIRDEKPRSSHRHRRPNPVFY
jgi:hypothetical protein